MKMCSDKDNFKHDVQDKTLFCGRLTRINESRLIQKYLQTLHKNKGYNKMH